MKIAIKNPAPRGPSLERWGDYHFGVSLQAALEARGVDVVQHFWPEWDQRGDEDVVLVLRGKRRYRPKPGQVTVQWIISHPGTVSEEELREHDLVYCAGERLLQEVRAASGVRASLMRQCTDATRFNGKVAMDADQRWGSVFVANSRGVRREILAWALEAGVPPILIGSQWSELGLARLVAKEYIGNAELPALYGASRIALNDHWGDMRHYGIISNRIFDCLACGTPVVSDGFPDLAQLCGTGVSIVHDTRSFWERHWESRHRYPAMLERAQRAWERIGPEHSFEARAAQMADDFAKLLSAGADGSAARGLERAELSGWIAEALSEARSRKSNARSQMRILHLCPTSSTAALLAELGNTQIHSAGPGDGPWQFATGDGIARRILGPIDLVILERPDLWPPGEELAAVLKDVSRLLGDTSLLAAPPDFEPPSGWIGRGSFYEKKL